ncbi:MAG: hypothetical protein ACRDP3_26470, partial [Streptomyces sp.]
MRTSARMTGAVVAVAAAALLVSGCGSSGEEGGKDDKAEGKPESKPTAEETAKTPAKDGPGTLPGIWHTKVGGKEFVLTIA